MWLLVLLLLAIFVATEKNFRLPNIGILAMTTMITILSSIANASSIGVNLGTTTTISYHYCGSFC